MRTSVPCLDTSAIEWSAGAPISRKVLNGDPDAGAHTVLLRSAPRPQPEVKPQFHDVDEEFFCLEGRFTFDGRTFFEPRSYVFFPAGTVHGSAVHVPDGYVIYLRNGGRVGSFGVKRPAHPTPYAVEPAGSERQITMIAPPRPTDWTGSELSIGWRPLGGRAASGESATLLRLPAGWRGRPARQAGYVELLVLEGLVEKEDGHALGPGCYAYAAPGEEQPGMTSPAGALVLVNHGRELAGFPDCGTSPPPLR